MAVVPVDPVFKVESHWVSGRVGVFSLLRVNVTAIRTEDGLVLVDTQRSPASMKAVVRAVREMFGELPVTHVVNTHGHWDHTSGNQLFPLAEIVGHELCAEHLRRMPATWRRTLWGIELESKSTEWQAVRQSLETDYRPAPPNRGFEGRLELEVGGLRIVLVDASGAHTGSDILAYLPSERIVITGDILCSSTSPCFSVNAVTAGSRVLKALDEILALGVDTVIPGHGDPLTGTDLRVFRDTLQPRFEELAFRSSAVPEPDFTDEELDRLGWDLFTGGSPDEAIQLFHEALARFSDSALLHESLGEIYLATGNLEAARSSLARAVKINPWSLFARSILEDSDPT